MAEQQFELTDGELWEAFEDALCAQPGGEGVHPADDDTRLTTREMAARIGIAPRSMRDRVRNAIDAGRMAADGRKWQVDCTGRRYRAPCYRVVTDNSE